MSDTPTIEQVRDEPAGERMDAWVATIVMGWTKGDDGWWLDAGGELMKPFRGEPRFVWWSPSTDLNDAWRAGEQFYSHDLERSAESYAVVYANGEVYGAADDNPALALCRAALIAKLEVNA